MTGTRRSFLGAVWRRVRPSTLRGRLLVIALPVLVLLVFLSPVLGAIGLVADWGGALLRPMLRDATGRLLAVCLALAAGGCLAVYLLRDRVRVLRAGLLLRQHLEALAAWLRDDSRRARELWQGVVRSRAPLPSEYRAVRDDAQLKLARLALEAGNAGEAMAWVLRVPGEGLAPALERTHAQLRARAVVATRESLPESCRREIEDALSAWPEDVVLLRLLRDRLAADGDLLAAARVQARVWRVCEPARMDVERDVLVERWLAAAEQAMGRGDLQEAEACLASARDVDASAVEASLLDGELRLRRDDLPGALRAWSRVPGSSGLARAAEALDAAPRPLAARTILEACPTEGGLLLAARAWARAGEARLAVRAAQKAARLLGPSPTVSAVLADVLRVAGDPGADAFVAAAVTRLPHGV